MKAALGVIVQGGDGTQNETGTGAGSGWDYVGSVNGASGIYLGNYDGNFWVLTAGHVGEGNFFLGGITYGLLPGSGISLGADVDLRLFQITTDPGLTTLDLAADTPANGASLTMIGFGIGRAASSTRWDVNWNETSNPILGIHQGYKWTEPQKQRWGANTLAGDGGSAITTASFYTNFGTGAGQATTGDSGGGVFLPNGALAGVMLAVTSASGQPGSTSIYSSPTAVGRTYSADISVYRDQILSIISPTPVPEPQTWVAILLGGVLSVMALRGRRR